MTKQSCDRCGADITSKKSAVVEGVGEADSDRNGTIDASYDFCARCFALWKKWMPMMPKATR